MLFGDKNDSFKNLPSEIDKYQQELDEHDKEIDVRNEAYQKQIDEGMKSILERHQKDK